MDQQRTHAGDGGQIDTENSAVLTAQLEIRAIAFRFLGRPRDRRRLCTARQAPKRRKSKVAPASFALVSEEAGAVDAGIELVLSGGRRLRIRCGVDEQTLRSVLAAMESAGC